MKPSGIAPGTGELRFFLIATFAWSWAFWFVLAFLTRRGLVSAGTAVFLLLHIAGGFGPTIFALISAARRTGDRPLAIFLRTWTPGRLSPAGFAILGAGLPSSSRRTGSLWLFGPHLRALVETGPAMLARFPVMIIGGGLEEPGWRGIVYDDSKRLQSGELTALAGLALAWTAWHLPLWLIPGTYQSAAMDLPAFALNVAELTLVFFALRMSGASVGWCILSHALYNTVLGVFTPGRDPASERLVSAMALAAIFALFIVFRGRIRAHPGNARA